MADSHDELVPMESTWARNRSHVSVAKHLAIVWDFAEVNPFANISGCLDGVIEYICEVIEANSSAGLPRARAGSICHGAPNFHYRYCEPVRHRPAILRCGSVR